MEIKNTGNRSWTINNGVEGFDLSSLPRCCGTAKTTGKPCQRAAKKGRNFCGIHAGDYTPGRKKGAQSRLKHGFYTETARQERKTAKDLIRAIHETIGTVKEEADYPDGTIHGYDRDVREDERRETCNPKQ